MDSKILIILSFIIQLIWFFSSIFLKKSLKKNTGFLSIFFSSLQFITAVLIFIEVIRFNQNISWVSDWFVFDNTKTFPLSFEINSFVSFLWLIVSSIFFLISLLKMFALGDDGEETNLVEVATPVMCFAALLITSSANFFVFFSGWILFSVAIFLGLNQITSNNKSETKVLRLSIFNVFSDLVVLAGILGVYKQFHSVNFTEVLDKGSFNNSFLIFSIGITLKLIGFPFFGYFKEVSQKSPFSEMILISFYTLGAVVVSNKFLLPFHNQDNFNILLGLSIFSLVVQSVQTISYKNKIQVSGSITGYVVCSILISSLTGNVEGTQVLSLFGILFVATFTLANKYLKDGESIKTWVYLLAAITISSLPVMGWGWGKYLVFDYFLNMAQVSPINFVFVAILMVVDFVIATSIYHLCFENKLIQKNKSANIYIAAFTLLLLLNTSIVLGGKIFGGLENDSILEMTKGFRWLETNIFLNSNVDKSLAGKDDYLYLLLISFAAFIVPFLGSFFLLFKDKTRIQNFREMISNFNKSLNQDKFSLDYLLIDNVIKNSIIYANTLLEFIDKYILSLFMSVPSFFVYKIFGRSCIGIEKNVFENILNNGISKMFFLSSLQLRKIHSGKVQSYAVLSVVLIFIIFGLMLFYR